MTLELQVKKDNPKVLHLFWDGELWKSVSKSLFINEVKKFPPGLTWEELNSRFSAAEEKLAKRYVLFLLSRRSLLSSEVEAKLLDRGISSDCVNRIVEFCVKEGYLNDPNQIERFFSRELKKGRPAKAAYFKIKQKGVSCSDLRAHYEHALTSERDALLKWLEKNKKKINRDDPKEMRKWIAKLCRRGFSTEIVLRELATKDL